MNNKLFELVFGNINFQRAIELIDDVYYDSDATSEQVALLYDYVNESIPIEVRFEVLLYLKMRSALHSLGFLRDVKPWALHFDHTSVTRGYVSTKLVHVDPYNGRFGIGVKVRRHNYDSNRCAYCDYYIYKEEV